jgi:hypothetical protein
LTADDAASFELSCEPANGTGNREVFRLFGLRSDGFSPVLGRFWRGGLSLPYSKLYVTVRAIDFFAVRRNLIVSYCSTEFT